MSTSGGRVKVDHRNPGGFSGIPAILGATELGPDVLELGPGYGATTEVLREQVDRLTAIEIHAGLAARLVERFIGMNVEVVVGDATDLTLQDHRSSAAVSFFMLHHVPSQQQQDRVFAEVTRVLQPGGLFVVADSLASDDLLEFHKGDIYVPIGPAVLADRLTIAGLWLSPSGLTKTIGTPQLASQRRPD